MEVEHSVVALTLSPLAAVVRFSSDASKLGELGVSLVDPCVGVTFVNHRDLLHAARRRRTPVVEPVVHPKRGRGSWPVGSIISSSQLGIGKHQLDARSASSGGQQHEGAFLTLSIFRSLSSDIALAPISSRLFLRSFSLSSRSILEYVHPAARTIGRRITDEAR